MTEIAAVNLNGRWGVAHGGEQAAGVACGGRRRPSQALAGLQRRSPSFSAPTVLKLGGLYREQLSLRLRGDACELRRDDAPHSGWPNEAQGFPEGIWRVRD